MAFLSYSSVPGMSVPGAAVPGKDGTATPGTRYVFIGPYQLYYLDYLDALTQRTLSAVPGGSYSMMPVNSRAGLTVPPPDNRWAGGGFMLRRPRAVRRLSAAQIAAARERALAAHGHYVSGTCPHCTPAPGRTPPALPVSAERAHGHFPGAACGHCAPAPRQTPPALAEAEAAHGHFPGAACGHCVPASRESVTTATRVPGPDVAPRQSLAEVRALLEQARVAHGHYAPGGCKLCMSGGQAT